MRTRMTALMVLLLAIVFTVAMAAAQTSGSSSSASPSQGSSTSSQTTTTTTQTPSTSDQNANTGAATNQGTAGQTGKHAKNKKKLPQTASPLPLLGILGLGSLAAGVVRRKRG
jgi:cytoskeletal protein RodZ